MSTLQSPGVVIHQDDTLEIETQEVEEHQEQKNQAQEQEMEATIAEAGEEEDDIRLQTTEKKKRQKKVPVALVREAGKSLLPFSRVQKIIKADKDIPIIAKDATFLISLATEEFIQRLCEAGQRVADREKRTTVQHKDIATVVRKADEFLFLEEILPWTSSDPPAKRKPKGTVAEGIKAAPTLLDQFVVTSKGDREDPSDQQGDIIMNEDGTMYTTGGEMDEGVE